MKDIAEKSEIQDKRSPVAGVAIMGYGVVGKGVAHALRNNAALIEKRAGVRFKLLHVLDLLDFPDSPEANLMTRDVGDVMDDADVRVVVETMGGLKAAYEYTKTAFEKKKHVVTSNKELVAEYGPELLAIAARNNVCYRFDASVGGGVPIVKPIAECLAANRFGGITGILNGTTNYMLSYMKSHGSQFAETLRKAQEKGYAEIEPSSDVMGHDARRKLAILSSIAFGSFLDWKTIHTEGIENITLEDIGRATELGRVVKLIASVRQTTGGNYEAYVLPAMVEKNCLLAGVDGVFNGIVVHGDLTDDVMFYGRGAGMYPTGSAIVSDIVDIALSGEFGGRAENSNESAEFVNRRVKNQR